MLAVVHDPTVPLRNMGVLNDDNSVNSQIWTLLGSDLKGVENELDIKFDDIDTFKQFLPTAPYIFILYGDNPRSMVGVFEVPYAMPETAISAFNGLLAEQGVSPEERKVGDYSAYFYERGHAGVLVMKDRLILSFSDSTSDVESRLNAIGTGTVKSIMNSSQKDNLKKVLAEPFNAMAYISGNSPLIKEFYKEATRAAGNDVDADYLEAAMTFDALAYHGYIAENAVKIQGSTFGQAVDHPKIKTLFEMDGKDKFIAKSGISPLMALKFGIPSWESLKNMFGDDERRDIEGAVGIVKNETGIDFEADILEKIGSPMSIVLADMDIATNQYNVALWLPLKDSAGFEQVLEKIVGLAAKESMVISKEGDFYVLPAPVTALVSGVPMKVGFGIKDSHLVIGVGDKTFESLVQGGLKSNKVTELLQSDSIGAVAMDLTQIAPIVDFASTLLEQQSKMAYGPEKIAITMVSGLVKDLVTDMDFLALDTVYVKENKGFHARAKFTTKSPFKKLFTEKLLPLAAMTAKMAR